MASKNPSVGTRSQTTTCPFDIVIVTLLSCSESSGGMGELWGMEPIFDGPSITVVMMMDVGHNDFQLNRPF